MTTLGVHVIVEVEKPVTTLAEAINRMFSDLEKARERHCIPMRVVLGTPPVDDAE